MKLIITGCCGFIGFHFTKKMLKSGYHVLGVDSLNSYYRKELKVSRLKILQEFNSFQFIQGDISKISMKGIDFKADHFVHLAAQAGVRYSQENPRAYVESNILGFFNVIEYCHERKIKLTYASSSSVYGENDNKISSEGHISLNPNSFYALTKKGNEEMAEIYSKNFSFHANGLRFFTVYGPWGRPDMSYWSFTEALYKNSKIRVFGSLDISRDFTYVDDVVMCMEQMLNMDIQQHQVFNITSSANRTLSDMIKILEELTRKQAEIIIEENQIGDVSRISASNDKIFDHLGIAPKVQLEEGLAEFVRWYKKYYNV